MLTDSDIARMDAIMNRVLARREARGVIPDRDEERIADILWQAEKAAADEHVRWLESRNDFASAVKYQEAAYESEGKKEFPIFEEFENFEDFDFS